MSSPLPANRWANRLPITIATVLAGLIAAACAGGASGQGWGPEAPKKAPAATFDPPATDGHLQVAVLSGGCFWGVQGVFEHVKGVRKVLAGYAGGKKGTAEYEIVSTGTTGHAESVKIVFDPRQVSYGEILRIYFSVATDPTQLNEQYPDHGTQYRGEIFYMDEGQKAVAERYITQLDAAKLFHRSIVTRVDPFNGFYDAEGYHQDYLIHHPDASYISTFDLPKVAALKALFPTEYRAEPVTAL
jgi:peptide-methionine (S)-S-oxide reductase